MLVATGVRVDVGVGVHIAVAVLVGVAVAVLAGPDVYSSAVLSAVPSILLTPPVKRTWPLGSRVAVWKIRAVVIVAVRCVKVLATGSYTSAVLRMVGLVLVPCPPPAMRICPSGSRVAACFSRAVVIVAASALKALVTGS